MQHVVLSKNEGETPDFIDVSGDFTVEFQGPEFCSFRSVIFWGCSLTEAGLIQ